MDPFFQETVKKEIDGKIQAIHEYDGMLWKLRIGFLSLYFAGWGMLLNTFMKIGNEEKLLISLHTLLSVMALITIVICIGGFIIDFNYIKRKYRVIMSLNALYKLIFNEKFQKDLNAPDFKELVQLSGSSDSTSYLQSSGYPNEKWITYSIYGLPFLIMVIGITIMWFDLGLL